MTFNNIENNPTISFDTDNKKAGFRLKYLQVYNWGLYNNEVFTISPEMQSSLLIGGNASGKTTLIDALLTLFLSNPKYNLAGDAQKKRDRDISSLEIFWQ
ncbi:MAG: ATP-binding protein [Bacteroidota bacterium]|nr:ATP-binding protein [Bacteroidota bacterium]